ncbi:hypothetical protein D3C76_734720 [compost metagenome]
MAAFSTLAVSSTTTGGFPAPAPIAFLPVDITFLTIAGPPVATNTRTLGWSIIALVFSIEGSLTVTIKFFGAPASSNALFNIVINLIETFLALGCGLKTTVFPPAIIDIELQIIVSVGFVVGVIEPITPNGQYSIKVIPLSPVIASVTRSSVPGVFSAATLFLINLCSYLPISVSSTAILEISSKFSLFNTVDFIMFIYFCLFAIDVFNSSFCATSEASIASSIVLKMP